MKLTAIEARWYAAIAKHIAPPAPSEGAELNADWPEQSGPRRSERLMPLEGEVDYVGALTRLNGPARLKVRLGLRALIAMMNLAPVWHQGKLSTLEKLDAAEAEALIVELAEHPLQVVRELMLLLKMQVAMGLLGTPSVRARSGYDVGRSEGMPVRLRLKKTRNAKSGVRPETKQGEAA